MKEQVNIDAVFIGGGIIGLLTALKYSEKFPKEFIAVIDKEQYLGDHTTGRNSGVMHAGIYYDTNSLKHKLCIEGNKLWKSLSKNYNIPYMNTGKFIIACSNEEIPLLEKTKEKALRNGVKGIRETTKAELLLLSTFTHAVAGIYSETTGILDASEAINRIEDELYKKDIPILKNTEAQSIQVNKDEFRVETNNEIIVAKKLFNCAGLGAIKIRKMIGLYDLEDYFVKGNYLTCSKKIKVDSLVYPVPLKNLKGLGVHLTLDFQGKIKFGPDTEDTSEIKYNIEDETKNRMFQSISHIFKDITLNDLEVDYCGIRPKIKHNGELYKDFWIKGPKDHLISGYFECCGIESPGLTSAPAIANYLIKQVGF